MMETVCFCIRYRVCLSNGKQASRGFGNDNPIKKGVEQCYFELLGQKVYVGLCDEAGKVYSPGKDP